MKKLIIFIGVISIIILFFEPRAKFFMKQTCQGQSSNDKLQTKYYTFEQIYQMLLFEINQEKLISRLPTDLKFTLVSNSHKELLQLNLSKPMVKSVTDYITNINDQVSEPYVKQGIDEFISYIDNCVGKKLGQIKQEMIRIPIAELTQGLPKRMPNRDEDYDFQIPKEIVLAQNYPNPFNPTTTIEYSVPSYSRVSLHIINVQGQDVITLVDEYQQAGIKKIQWDGRNSMGLIVPSGIYLFRLSIEGNQLTKKMILIR